MRDELKPFDVLLKLQQEVFPRNLDGKSFQKRMEKSLPKTLELMLEKYKGELSADEIKIVKKKLEEHINGIKKIELPTTLQDPNSYSQILEIAEIIKNASETCHMIEKESGKVIKVKEMNLNFKTPKFGTVHFGTVNAAMIPCDNDEVLIVFEVEFFIFCWLISKVFAKLFPAYNSEEKNLEYYFREVDKKIEQQKDAVKHFEELVIAYAITGKVGYAPQYIIEAKFNNKVRRIASVMEVFAMSHEYAHMLLDHVHHESNETNPIAKGIENILFSWPQEFEADQLGTMLTLEGMKNIQDGNILVTICGIEIFFSTFEIIQKARCLFNGGDEKYYWKEGGVEQGKVGTHPPFEERRKKQREHISGVFGEKSLEMGLIAEYMLTRLWNETRNKMIERMEKMKKE